MHSAKTTLSNAYIKGCNRFLSFFLSIIRTSTTKDDNLYNNFHAKPLLFGMPIDRSLGRNVHFYDATSPGFALGGLIQNGSVTEENFLEMLRILLVTEAPLRIQARTSGYVLTSTNNPLPLGDYDIYCNGR